LDQIKETGILNTKAEELENLLGLNHKFQDHKDNKGTGLD
jgi:hypothetical protein